MAIEQRRHLRHSQYSLIDFSFDGVDSGIVLNVSGGGIAVTIRSPVAIGVSKQIGFKVPRSDGRIECTGEVVWTDQSRAGLRFVNPPEPSRQMLRSWLGAEWDDSQAEIASLRGKLSHLSLLYPSEQAAPTHISTVKKALLAACMLALVTYAGHRWFKHAQAKTSLGHHVKSEAGPARSSPEESIPKLETTVGGLEPSRAAASDSSSAAEKKPDMLPLVTNIRRRATANYIQVIVELQAPVKYAAHRLHKPERIYFDLYGAGLSSDLHVRKFYSSDALVHRIRVGQPEAGLSRVVLDTNSSPGCRVTLAPSPYRLVVDISSRSPASGECVVY